jgi:hypothetical protein
MAVIVRLEGEMPPVVVPPYSMNGDTTVSELMEAACKFFKREPGESKLIAFDSGQELNELGRQLKDYGLGHWSLMTLVPTTGKAYKRVTFGN